MLWLARMPGRTLAARRPRLATMRAGLRRIHPDQRQSFSRGRHSSNSSTNAGWNRSNSNDMRRQFLSVLGFVVAVATGIDVYRTDATVGFDSDLANGEKALTARALPQPSGL